MVRVHDKVAASLSYLGLNIEKSPCGAFFMTFYLMLVDYHYKSKSERFSQRKPSNSSESEGQSRRHLPTLVLVTLRRAGRINYVVFDYTREFVIMQ